MDHRPDTTFLASPLARAAIAAVLLAALAAAFFAVRSARSDGTGSGGPSLDGAPTIVGEPSPETGLGPLDGGPPVVGQPAPDFALRDLDGNVVRLSDLRGSVVWINFWATWCTPCKKELPEIQALQDERRDDGLVVLTVNWQEPAEDARAYLEHAGLTLTSLLDRGGVYDQYRLRGLPDSFFIDREGNLAALHYGFLTDSKMRERLAQAGLE